MVTSLKGTMHGTKAFEKFSAQGCEACHGPGSAHVEEGGDLTQIKRLGIMKASEASEVCLQCHNTGNRTMHLFLAFVLAVSLPTYEDFRRVDRVRRLTGQLNTAELLELTRIDPALIAQTAQQHTNDVQALWGAAELTVDWPGKRAYYESALAAGRTNAAVALRFACTAAHRRDFEVAQPWLRYCEKNDSGNLVPWLVEWWVLRQKNEEIKSPPNVVIVRPDAPERSCLISVINAASPLPPLPSNM